METLIAELDAHYLLTKKVFHQNVTTGAHSSVATQISNKDSTHQTDRFVRSQIACLPLISYILYLMITQQQKMHSLSS